MKFFLMSSSFPFQRSSTEVYAAQYQKNKQSNKKIGEDLNRNFSKEDIPIAKKHMKNVQYHLLSEQWKSKLQWGITSFTPVKCLSSKILQPINAGENVEKREPLYTVGENVNWYSHYGE